ncbi:OLC1v1003239C1 [Oldenlandia corymbosa var. corymbosa]|uniref:OLC1v1003239C1 n=1 Tax=Oldenlandia corymbosa var. corymbosa TaxID=529605 RepID=A0AAV1D9K9_OLDCO|nr:OLC1v1003239C1 [Oldenlandia corymbosa var. corymbosa]
MMDFKQLEDLVKDSDGGISEKKQAVAEVLGKDDENQAKSSIDSAGSLQLFLDHIPISSISDIIVNNPFPEVEAKPTDNVGYILHLMREKDVKTAPLVHKLSDEHGLKKFAEEYIGLIDLDTLILWFLQECESSGARREDLEGEDEIGDKGFSCKLEQNHPVLQTKVGELAKLFLWDPFFPIHVNDSLFHVLMLLSKHRLQVVPVTEKSDSRIIGFVYQNAVVRALLEASGLEWFDNIADKTLSECRLETEQVEKIHGDESMVEALRNLWESRARSIAIIEPETEKLIGSVRATDVYRLFEDIDLYSDRKNLKVKEFIQLNAEKGQPETRTKEVARVRNPRMISPVTNRVSDTVKEAMKKLAESQSNVSFLIDEYDRVEGLITLRAIMAQFAPPGIDSRIRDGGFFESALQQAGCHVSEGGSIRCDKKSSLM